MMSNQEVDMLKEEVEMLSKQMRQQCSIIKDVDRYLMKLHEILLDYDLDYMKSPLRSQVDEVLERVRLCK